MFPEFCLPRGVFSLTVWAPNGAILHSFWFPARERWLKCFFSFSFLSKVPRASPPTASPGRPCARTPLWLDSLAEMLPECAQELREGEEEKGNERPGRNPTSSGRSAPWAPRASPAGSVWHQLHPGCQAAEQRPGPPRTRPFVGGQHKGEGKTSLPF